MLQKKFIKATNTYGSFDVHMSAPYLRRSFELDFVPESAMLSICGLGFYRLFCNGTEITKGALAPYISNPDHYCYYDVYDISEYLQAGENVIGILLGNGFMNPFGGAVWDFDKAEWRGAPRVALELTAQGGDKEFLLEADERFKVHASPILFDELRMGEQYDANLEIPGWNLPGFDDHGWKNAILAQAPRGELRKCEAEPILVQKKIKPVSVTKCEDGYLYDFGENIAGLTELQIVAEPGQKIVLWHGEILRDGRFYNGNIIFQRPECEYYKEYNQKTIYIAKGGKKEVYIPSFTYYGFRYVLVQGLKEEQAGEELLTCLVMNSDLRHIGGFSCSDETANTLFEMVQRSDLANFYYFPTDCPHREKNGWTGDASMSAEHMVLLYDVEKSWREWLANIRKSQNDVGAFPGIVPTAGWGFDWGNGPAWDSVLFNLPYMLYKYRGNTEVITENAHAMLRYLEYIGRRRNEEGLIAVGLGDWVPVNRGGDEYQAPLGFTDSVMVYDMCCKGRTMFRALGLDGHAAFAEQLGEELLTAVRSRYIDRDTMVIESACQTAQAMGLYYGIFADDEKQEAFAKLLKILKRDGEKLTCGFLGTRVLYHVLAEYGEAELAWRMITGKEFPAYGYLVEQGATTLPEQFLSDERKWTVSQNHHFLGDVAQWFMRYPGGIRIMDSTHVVIQPEFIEELNDVKASHQLPAGEITVSWRRENGRIRLEVDCPDGVVCQVETGKWKDIVDMGS